MYRQMLGRPLSGDVLDIGAHHGAFALSALGAGAEFVFCVEPAKANFDVLIENLDGYRDDRASLLLAVALETDDLYVSLRKAANGNSGQHSVAFHAGHPVSDAEVPVMRFTDLLAMVPRWSYVKIDVEGAEWSLLRGPDDVLAFDHVDFLDLEVHPLDNAEYYPAKPATSYAYVDVVGEWFRQHGRIVKWTAHHPTRLFVAKEA